jgi:hypothetical protein
MKKEAKYYYSSSKVEKIRGNGKTRSGVIPHSLLESVRSAGAGSRVSAGAAMNAHNPRALDPAPSPLLCASS